VQVQKVEKGSARLESDLLAVEEPLEILLGTYSQGRRLEKTLSITMRTPGHDRELAAGFLYTEGIVLRPQDIEGVFPSRNSEGDLHNGIRVDLRPGVEFDDTRLDRHFYTTSSCGVCGKASLQTLRVHPSRKILADRPRVDSRVIEGLGPTLRAGQKVFRQTGGLHAAGLFDSGGNLLSLREDVGRHNAVDKLIGREVLGGRLPLEDRLMMVSGRTSFEILQKAVMAGIAMVVAVSAPSSLAAELARDFGMTLVGFVRPGRFNVYAHGERIRWESAQAVNSPW
jgi:FdhD protein